MVIESTGRGRRVASAGLWVLQVILALAFLAVAVGKFTGAPQEVGAFHAMGVGAWFRYLVGALEVSGAAGLLIPRLTGLAALGLTLLMVGALVTQILVVGSGAWLPVPYLIAAALIAWARRAGTVRIWAMVRAAGPRA